MAVNGRIPRSQNNDYSEDIINERQGFSEKKTTVLLNDTRQFSFDAEDMFSVGQSNTGITGPLLGTEEPVQRIVVKIGRDTRSNDKVDLQTKLGRNR